MRRLLFALLLISSPALAGKGVSVTMTPTISNSSYSSTFSIGGLIKVPFFMNPGLAGGTVNQVMLHWSGTETVAVTFYIWKGLPTHSTCNNLSPIIQLDDALLATAPFTLTAAAPAGTTHTSVSAPVVFSVRNADATVNLYVCAVAGAAFTPALADFNFTISGIADSGTD